MELWMGEGIFARVPVRDLVQDFIHVIDVAVWDPALGSADSTGVFVVEVGLLGKDHLFLRQDELKLDNLGARPL